MLLFYVGVEIWFLTGLTNTLATYLTRPDVEAIEHTGRLVTALGFALSLLIGLSANQILDNLNIAKRTLIKLGLAATVAAIAYFGVKTLYEGIKDRVKPNIVQCSLLGGLAVDALDEGKLPLFKELQTEGVYSPLAKLQLVRMLLPLHICMDESARKQFIVSDYIRHSAADQFQGIELATNTSKALQTVYEGFRDVLPNLVPSFNHIQDAATDNQLRLARIEEAKTTIATQLDRDHFRNNAEKRYILETFVCASNRAINNQFDGPSERQFMLGVTSCLFDKLRKRVPTLPAPEQATDIYKLNQITIEAVLRQLWRDPSKVDPIIVNRLRDSFALVFLPAFAVCVSVFVISLCIASYIRSRFAIYALSRNKRVNPIANALLSILVVVPGIWTLIFLFVPASELENALFPKRGLTSELLVAKVAMRPLIMLYPDFYQQAHYIGGAPILGSAASSQFRKQEYLQLESALNKAREMQHFVTPSATSTLRFLTMAVSQGYMPGQFNELLDQLENGVAQKNLPRSLLLPFKKGENEASLSASDKYQTTQRVLKIRASEPENNEEFVTQFLGLYSGELCLEDQCESIRLEFFDQAVDPMLTINGSCKVEVYFESQPRLSSIFFREKASECGSKVTWILQAHVGRYFLTVNELENVRQTQLERWKI